MKKINQIESENSKKNLTLDYFKNISRVEMRPNQGDFHNLAKLDVSTNGLFKIHRRINHHKGVIEPDFELGILNSMIYLHRNFRNNFLEIVKKGDVVTFYTSKEAYEHDNGKAGREGTHEINETDIGKPVIIDIKTKTTKILDSKL